MAANPDFTSALPKERGPFYFLMATILKAWSVQQLNYSHSRAPSCCCSQYTPLLLNLNSTQLTFSHPRLHPRRRPRPTPHAPRSGIAKSSSPSSKKASVAPNPSTPSKEPVNGAPLASQVSPAPTPTPTEADASANNGGQNGGSWGLGGLDDHLHTYFSSTSYAHSQPPTPTTHPHDLYTLTHLPQFRRAPRGYDGGGLDAIPSRRRAERCCSQAHAEQKKAYRTDKQ